MKRIIFSILTILTLLAVTAAIIAYARGYRFNPEDGELAGTGLLVATSKPDGAQVFVDGELKTATNATINLLPGKHKVKITKEGFQPWEKSLKIYEEVVAQTDAVLFPSNPGLSPLTNTGVQSPSISPDGTAIAFVKRPPEATPSSDLRPTTSGIFVLELSDRPLSFSRNPRQILSFNDLPNFKFQTSNFKLIWSPDADQILAVLTNPEEENTTAYLLNSSTKNTTLFPVPSIQETLSLWEEQHELERQTQVKSLPEKLLPIFTRTITKDETEPAAEILSFSPDETKILYEAKRKSNIPQVIKPSLIGVNPTEETRTIDPGNLYVYDLKEDRNYLIGKSEEYQIQSQNPPNPPNNPNLRDLANFKFQISNFKLSWFPTSRHLLYTEDKKIKVMEYDAANKTTLYAGPFYKNFIVPWPNGSKLVILTTLNPDAGESLNLYAVKLR